MEIEPFVGIGTIKFGTSRKDIRKHFGINFTSFKKTSFSINETDAYNELGIHFYYDDRDTLEFMEIFPPFSITFQGVSLLENSAEEIKNKLTDIGVKLIPNDVGYDVPAYGFGLYVREERIDGVCIYRKDYYKA